MESEKNKGFAMNIQGYNTKSRNSLCRISRHNLTIGSESIITDDDKNPNLNEADLQELNRSKALSVIPSKVPVGLASKLGLKSSSESVNIVSSLIGSSTDDSLRKLNLESVIDAFPSKDSSFDKNFSHFRIYWLHFAVEKCS